MLKSPFLQELQIHQMYDNRDRGIIGQWRLPVRYGPIHGYSVQGRGDCGSEYEMR